MWLEKVQCSGASPTLTITGHLSIQNALFQLMPSILCWNLHLVFNFGGLPDSSSICDVCCLQPPPPPVNEMLSKNTLPGSCK